MTTPRKRSAEIRAEASQLWQEASALDATAEALFAQAHPENVAQIRERARTVGITTRVPVRRQLHLAVRKCSTPRCEGCVAARAAFARADALYWRVVELYRGFILTLARQHARLSPHADISDVEMVLILGAFDAAVNWQPEVGAFTTYAQFQLYSHWQRASERQSVVPMGHSRAMRAEKGFGRVPTISLDTPQAASDDGKEVLSLYGALSAGDPPDFPTLLLFPRAAELISRMPPRMQLAVEDFSQGRTAGDTARTLHITRSRVNQLLKDAFARLRTALVAEGDESRARAKPRPAASRVQSMVDALGAKATARELGMSPSTLYRQLRASKRASVARESAPPQGSTPDTPGYAQEC